MLAHRLGFLVGFCLFLFFSSLFLLFFSFPSALDDKNFSSSDVCGRFLTPSPTGTFFSTGKLHFLSFESVRFILSSFPF